MARRKDKEKAINLRLRGHSYSQIKEELGISKSTLSTWLRDYPLSEERIRELRDLNPQRIERSRNTKRKKREAVLKKAFNACAEDVGELSERDLFIAGLFLYWAEGGKTQRYSVTLTNTNPSMILFFIQWLESLGAKRGKIKVKLHLYSDMDIQEKIDYWSKITGLPKDQFRKPYIKNSKHSDITYKNKFTEGTCNIIYGGKEISDYVLMGVKYLESLFV